MQSPCQQENQDSYAVRHNPWAYFVDERSLCDEHDVPLDRLAADVDSGNLPAVGMLVPDVCHDAHDCPLAEADAWISDQIGMVMDGPDFATGRLAVVITADEDDGSDNNRILTVVAHPGLEHVGGPRAPRPLLAVACVRRGGRCPAAASGRRGDVAPPRLRTEGPLSLVPERPDPARPYIPAKNTLRSATTSSGTSSAA